MSRLKDQLTSTEKLFEQIRGENSEVKPKIEKQASSTHVLILPRLNPSRIFQIARAKTHTVGVDIGREYVRLVKAARMPDGQSRLLDKLRVRIPKDISPEDSEFAEFLKATLTWFRGSSTKMDLWTDISAAGIDVRYIRIPKVSKKQVETAVYWTIRKEAPFDEKEYILGL